MWLINAAKSHEYKRKLKKCTKSRWSTRTSSSHDFGFKEDFSSISFSGDPSPLYPLVHILWSFLQTEWPIQAVVLNNKWGTNFQTQKTKLEEDLLLANLPSPLHRLYQLSTTLLSCWWKQIHKSRSIGNNVLLENNNFYVSGKRLKRFHDGNPVNIKNDGDNWFRCLYF